MIIYGTTVQAVFPSHSVNVLPESVALVAGAAFALLPHFSRHTPQRFVLFHVRSAVSAWFWFQTLILLKRSRFTRGVLLTSASRYLSGVGVCRNPRQRLSLTMMRFTIVASIQLGLLRGYEG
jgi:hypothetical protein